MRLLRPTTEIEGNKRRGLTEDVRFRRINIRRPMYLCLDAIFPTLKRSLPGIRLSSPAAVSPFVKLPVSNSGLGRCKFISVVARSNSDCTPSTFLARGSYNTLMPRSHSRPARIFVRFPSRDAAPRFFNRKNAATIAIENHHSRSIRTS